MKKPLNFAILKYFTTVDEACPDDVVAALKDEYGKSRWLTKKAVLEALFTGQTNGFLEESRSEIVNGELRIYFKSPQESRELINKQIPD
jgi:hypothetical protein